MICSPTLTFPRRGSEDRKVHLKYIQGLVMICPQLSIATRLKIADFWASNPFTFALFGYYRAKKSSRLYCCKSYIEKQGIRFILRFYASAVEELAQLTALPSSLFSLTRLSQIWLTSSTVRSISQVLLLIRKVLFTRFLSIKPACFNEPSAFAKRPKFKKHIFFYYVCNISSAFLHVFCDDILCYKTPQY